KGRPPLIDGFTPEQRFFLSWAQVWREQMRPEMQRTLVNVNEHAPSKWRVDGPLSNMPEFRAAWAARTATRWCVPTACARTSGSRSLRRLPAEGDRALE